MVQVRRLHQRDDLRDLIALSRAVFTEYAGHRADFFAIDELKNEHIIDYFSRFLGKDDRAAFVARRCGRVVGYLTAHIETRPPYWSVHSVGHVSGLMVNQEHRREGIGSQLLAQARAYFKEQGVRRYTLYTAVGNEGALAFYESQGMEPLYVHLVGEIEEGP